MYTVLGISILREDNSGPGDGDFDEIMTDIEATPPINSVIMTDPALRYFKIQAREE